jgi:hypothetical protein
MAEKVAKEVKACISAGELLEQFDLGGFDEAKCAALVASAFQEAQPISGAMPKITFVIGGGKLSRQKYHADLGKYFSGALRDIGYKEDAGACAVVDSAGTYKQQHDTGQNIKVVHVFPRVEVQGGGGGGEDEDGGDLVALQTPEALVVMAKLDTFKKMVASKVPSWGEKKTLQELFTVYINQLGECEAKLIKGEVMSDSEQKLYDDVSAEELQAKVDWLGTEMKQMFADEELTADEIETVKAQVAERIGIVEAKLKEVEAAGKAAQVKKLQTNLENMKKRQAAAEGMTPHAHPLKAENEIRPLLKALKPLEKLAADKAPKTLKQMQQVGEIDDLKEELQGHLDRSRGWFEEEDVFNARYEALKKRFAGSAKNTKKKGGGGGGGGGKKKGGGGGALSFTTVGKKGSGAGGRGGAKKGSGGGKQNIFSMLGGDSSSDDD